MRIVVIGASGNVGSALLRRLDGTGHEVVGAVRRPPTSGPLASAAEWVTLDLSEPSCLAQLTDVLRGADACVFAAWALQPMRRPGYQRRVALGGAAMTVGACLGTGVRHLVVLSSTAAYAPRRDLAPVDEHYPVTGNPASEYSLEKSALEGLLQDLVRDSGDSGGAKGSGASGDRLTVSWVRPVLVSQRDAGSTLHRLGVGRLAPSRLLRHLPVLPVDQESAVQVVHADDVAAALHALLESRAPGPFNLAAPGLLGPSALAAPFGARAIRIPQDALLDVVRVAWRLRLEPISPGWMTMAGQVPVIDCERARRELGWVPAHDAGQVWSELIDSLASRQSGPSETLRRRTLPDDLRRALTEGPVTTRERT